MWKIPIKNIHERQLGCEDCTDITGGLRGLAAASQFIAGRISYRKISQKAFHLC
jgi:hypothetical protein